MNNVTSLEDYKRRKAEKFQQQWLDEFAQAMEWIRLENEKGRGILAIMAENESCTRKIAPIVFLRPPPDSAA